jgi:cytochrome c biogenesis protein CcmG/thiol:disulfide interchange protein DsbE
MTLLQSNSQRRNKLYPLLFLGLGIVLIAGSVYFLFQNIPSQTDLTAVPVEVNYSAPALSLTDIHGQLVSLADLRGQVVLVNLWATWCPPCKKEMPELESFYNKHKDDGFTIVAVNDGDPRADVVQFVKEYRLTFPVWLDPAYIATERAFKTLNLPSSYVINREGKVVLSWLGGINRKNLEKYVTPVIEEQP